MLCYDDRLSTDTPRGSGWHKNPTSCCIAASSSYRRIALLPDIIITTDLILIPAGKYQVKLDLHADCLLIRQPFPQNEKASCHTRLAEPAMDEDHNPDRLLAEPPEPVSQQHERTSSMSLEPTVSIDDASPANGEPDATAGAPPPAPQPDPNAKIVHEVVNSEVSEGVPYAVYPGADWSCRLVYRRCLTV